MLDVVRRIATPRAYIAAAIVLLVAVTGSYLLAGSNAQTPSQQPAARAGLLEPVSLGIAPYHYIAYSGSLEQVRQQTGVPHVFAAFIIADNGCNPSWGGTAQGAVGGVRSGQIAADITAVKAQGGNVIVSFGGANGTELASACQTADELTTAYRKVIDAYGVQRLDFDIEGPALLDQAASQRRAEAVKRLQAAYPELEVWVTLPVYSQGLTREGRGILADMVRQQVKLSGINIMAMNYNVAAKDMGRQAMDAADATAAQLQDIFPNDSNAAIWRALMVTVMAGHNNTPSEIFTLQDAAEVRRFALDRGIGTLSLWSAARDVQCADPRTPQPSVSCSGVPQQPYQFTRALTIPAR